MMKILLVTLLLAGMMMSGSALQCYSCAPDSGKPCAPTVENCASGKNACYQGTLDNQSFIRKSCMRMEECQDRKESRAMIVQCCQTNLCNK